MRGVGRTRPAGNGKGDGNGREGGSKGAHEKTRTMKDDAEKVECRQNVWRTVVRTMKDKEEQEEGEKDEGVRAAPNMKGPVGSHPQVTSDPVAEEGSRGRAAQAERRTNSARKDCTVRIRKKS